MIADQDFDHAAIRRRPTLGRGRAWQVNVLFARIRFAASMNRSRMSAAASLISRGHESDCLHIPGERRKEWTASAVKKCYLSVLVWLVHFDDNRIDERELCEISCR